MIVHDWVGPKCPKAVRGSANSTTITQAASAPLKFISLDWSQSVGSPPRSVAECSTPAAMAAGSAADAAPNPFAVPGTGDPDVSLDVLATMDRMMDSISTL